MKENKTPSSQSVPEPFPFTELCGTCRRLFTSACPFAGKTDALTRHKQLGCTRYVEE